MTCRQRRGNHDTKDEDGGVGVGVVVVSLVVMD